MRSISFIFLVIIVFLVLAPICFAADYDSRFIRNYPPGFHGMWYNAERFFTELDPNVRGSERYRWDRYMSNVMNMHYPFFPIPYDWDYGTGRTFGLPDYNMNEWR